ncbi:hypothetical protein S7711_07820 [Stachybotrys chartarum IBT 7711]|uniref:FIST domain-containing protein n=1 Tax=Stachybotrys chartarum (strain CBS 109288 / IBT 7711) TaxID=1280523 RepID=A0A084AQP4_STACB|nr:hypothetical protein S7711_07820 [Stachybotrys chartarum IBT 7711]
MPLLVSRLCRLAPTSLSLTNSNTGRISRRGAHDLRSRVKDLTRLTFLTSPSRPVHYAKVLATAKKHPQLENPDKHDAAVLLVTPEYSRALEDDQLMADFAQLMAGGTNVPQFHMAAGVVDTLRAHGPSGSPRSGISLLRGHSQNLLPRLWEPSPLKAVEDTDAASVLAFDLGRVSVTLPLANTIFHNQRPSTLFAYRFNAANGGLRLAQRVEKSSQTVDLALDPAPRSIADVDVSMALLPITRPRRVVNSFGNIVRRIEVDGESIPASAELEDVLNNPSDVVKSNALRGVWAVVAPQTSLMEEFESTYTSIAQAGSENSERTTSQLQKVLANGGRIYKILSGGGGWGTKKGLLSLDPQESHLALSEEEEMDRFMREMSDSGFAPADSSIQFFLALEESTTPREHLWFSLSVAGEPASDEAHDTADTMEAVTESFGACSNKGLFVSWPQGGGAGSESTLARWKLSVPNSVISIGNGGVL